MSRAFCPREPAREWMLVVGDRSKNNIKLQPKRSKDEIIAGLVFTSIHTRLEQQVVCPHSCKCSKTYHKILDSANHSSKFTLG